ncbi:hypothetical protein BABA_17647 [Neobacillus bataviensis LMG 21833]|uniref:Gram-positive cocci surface proteins LPxTG domain-containing protein n=1 Tax=Neobacillus bataviensis LMG 21833 TaxID=1117379 RepID=K6DYR2_9BACI|nr:hypothetical protein [Neobacillus bataviensis]EKN65991.1 hypothetical protein BABA_17647 [Neobacillus bataviensis LMG 21833]
MKKFLVIVSITLAFICPAISYAQNQTILTMEELSIRVMPEYAYHPNDQKKDHAPLLIGYQGSMVNNSDQPQKGKIEIPLPMQEKNFQIGFVADYSSDLRTTYEIEYVIDREKGTISWTSSEEIGPKERYKFVIEFYSDSLKVNKEKKSLSYQFKSFSDIGLVNMILTEPSKAKKIKLTPAPDKKQNHDGSDHTVSYLFQDVKAGEEKNFRLSYERSETKPTTELTDKVEPEGNKKSTGLALGAFSGISVLSAGALTFLFKKRKKKA